MRHSHLLLVPLLPALAFAARGVSAELMLLARERHGAARRGTRELQIGHTPRSVETHLRAHPSPLTTPDE